VLFGNPPINDEIQRAEERSNAQEIDLAARTNPQDDATDLVTKFADAPSRSTNDSAVQSLLLDSTL
jgi:hypothetical protein